MDDLAISKLLEDVEEQVLNGEATFGLLGLGSATLRVMDWFARAAPSVSLTLYLPENPQERAPMLSIPIRGGNALREDRPAVLIVAVDSDKEGVLRAALPFIDGAPKVIVSGYGHLAYRDPQFHTLIDGMLVPSIANGYPNTLIHLYQCLENASRLNINGVVAEFGVFKGGTTMFLARAIRAFSQNWKVLGFDTFGGFPSRRSPLDMYDHVGAEFNDLPSVRRYLADENIELVAGDIVETASRLETEDLVLTFIDTDNYTSARAALDVAAERTVVGGAIVFDHFTGVDRFRYTLGERMAGQHLLDDPRYFNLHSTGVFLRQQH